MRSERRSRRADGLARSLSRAGGINDAECRRGLVHWRWQSRLLILLMLALEVAKVHGRPKEGKGLGTRLRHHSTCDFNA